MHETAGTAVAYVTEVSIQAQQPRVHRVTAGVYAGRIVNPTGAEAQIQGGALFGLATTKPGFAIDVDHGAVRNASFVDYPPVRMQEAAPVDVFFVPSDAHPTGRQAGVPPIAPAVANGAFALTGQRMRALPFAPMLVASTAPTLPAAAEDDPYADLPAGGCRFRARQSRRRSRRRSITARPVSGSRARCRNSCGPNGAPGFRVSMR